MNNDPVTVSQQALSQRQLVNLLRWLLAAGVLTILVLLVFGIVLKAVALLWVNVVLVIGIGTMFLSYRQARRGEYRRAVNILVWTVAIFFPCMALFYQNGAWLFGLATLALTSFVGNTFWPRHRWWQALGLGILAGGMVFVLDWALTPWLPWERFDLQQYLLLSIFILIIIGLTVLLSLLSLYRIYQRITKISARLIVAIVSVVVVVAVALSTVSVVMGLSSAREQVSGQLESVAALKVSQVKNLVMNLQLDLDALVTEAYEVQRVRIVVVNDPLSNPQNARNGLRTRFQRVIARTQRFTELMVLDLDGTVVLSTEQDNEGLSYSQEQYFLRGKTEPYVAPISLAANRMTDEYAPFEIMVSMPVLDTYGDLIGVLVGRGSPQRMDEIMQERPGLGDSGETYVVDEQFNLLTSLRHNYDQTWLRTDSIETAIRHQDSTPEMYMGYYGEMVLGRAVWLDDLRIVIVTERSLDEVTQSALTTGLVNIGVAVGAVALAVLISLLFARDISLPLTNLAGTAARIAGGEYMLEAEVEREDEIGILAKAFNSMTAQLRGLIGGLEERVAERTRGLEAVAEVSSATVSELEMERLLPQVVNLVRERFGMYYVGLFIVDDADEFAILRAGTGEAGRAMIEQGWQLPVGGESMIGQCVATGQPGVRQSGSEGGEHFDNPLLAAARSELALPLRYGRRVIGAMTVQSVQKAAFDPAQIAVYQNLADQVAIAVQNARLFADARSALVRAQEVQQRYLGQAWEQYMRVRDVTGYEQVGQNVRPLGQDLLPQVQSALAGGDAAGGAQRRARSVGDAGLVVPLVQGDRVLGAIGFEGRDGQQKWSEDEIALVEALVEQLLLAAENQRLIDETQRRAAREQLTRQIVDRVRSADNIEDILRVTSESLSRQLNASEVVVRLGPESKLAGNQ